MLKRCCSFLLALAVILSLTACGDNQASYRQTDETEPNKLQVSVTFNAMREFVEAVGQDKVEIATLIPDGTEPHDFEPKAQDLVGLSTAQVFVYNGLGMESWVEDAIIAAGNKNLIVVEASKGVTPITSTNNEESLEHGQYDPHTWLSLKAAEIAVQNIKDALVKADPTNRDFYETNSTSFVAQLESLYNEYKAKFDSVQKKSFVTGHAAFAYLCQDFGLSQNSVEDVFAEGEPSAQQLTQLVAYCKENQVTTIFAEAMASPAVSQTLASEVGATVDTIYTLEGAEDGLNYLQRMEENLSKIYSSLSN